MADIISLIGFDDEAIGIPLVATIQPNAIAPGVMGTPLVTIAINMLGNQKVTVFAVPLHGLLPACVTGVPLWSTSDPTLVRLSPSADGLSCVVYSLGQSGTCQVYWTGQGSGTVMGTFTVIITSVLADNVVMTLGSPTNACC